jgi:hypothetical protein
MKWERFRNVLAQGRDKWVSQIVADAKERIQRGNEECASESVAEPEPAAPIVHERSHAGRQRDKGGGMELLDEPFLVDMVERAGGGDERDVRLRRLCFAELVRRGRLDLVSSQILADYAVDRSRVGEKAIQCEAIRELSRRTAIEGSDQKTEFAAGAMADE